jgi:type VI secretion system protein ImpA
LERAAVGKPEQQVGGTIVPAETPDWRALIEQATALLAASKDLRIAATMTRALVEVTVFDGLADGLALIRGLVERYWDTLHPQLDAEDGNDPTFRVNALAALTHRDMLNAIRSAPLVVSKAFGTVTLRALDAASTRPTDKKPAPPTDGKGAASSANIPTAATLEAAFHEAPHESLVGAAATLARCSQDARALADSWGERLPSAGPDFTELLRVLKQAENAVKSRADQRQSGDSNGTQADGKPGQSPATGEAAGALRGEVRSRDDVLRAIDAICAYYARAEPSSPVPLLLQRGRRLVTMSFLDIVKDMVPESIPSLQKIAGKTDG